MNFILMRFVGRFFLPHSRASKVSPHRDLSVSFLTIRMRHRHVHACAEPTCQYFPGRNQSHSKQSKPVNLSLRMLSILYQPNVCMGGRSLFFVPKSRQSPLER